MSKDSHDSPPTAIDVCQLCIVDLATDGQDLCILLPFFNSVNITLGDFLEKPTFISFDPNAVAKFGVICSGILWSSLEHVRFFFILCIKSFKFLKCSNYHTEKVVLN